MLELYYEVLYRPLFNGLVFLYQTLGHDLGIAIIVLTIFIKILLFYPSLVQLKTQRNLQQTQPKLKELQEKHKGNKEEYNRAVLQFYRENKVNPAASCLPIVLQFIVLIALYNVFIGGVVTDPTTRLLGADQLKNLYEPLRNIFSITPFNTYFFGFIDLSHAKNIPLAILSAFASYWQASMLTKMQPPKAAGSGAKDESLTASLNKSMTYSLPLITLFIGYTLPAGLPLYWLVSTLFQVGQQYYFLRRHAPSPTPPA
jgi:YidC/Oxa1 family membrane protein insertase